MIIGVVSDTHSHVVPRKVLDELKKVDLIVHAGDFCSKADLDVFRKLGKVRAVFGNMDGLELRQILPERDILEIAGLKVGLCHGRGGPNEVLASVQSEFKNAPVDLVIFGHSHYPLNEKIGGVMYFNPGSPTDMVRAPYRSYGILEIKNGRVDGTIIKVDP